MKYLVEVDPRRWQRLQVLLEKGQYDSVNQFVAVAIENQLQYELQSDERLIERAFSIDETSTASSSLPTTPLATEPPLLVATPKRISDEIVWGLYNRIFPIKITLRVLGQLLARSGGKAPNLELVREESSTKAKLIGKRLSLADRTAERISGEKWSTGLPLRRTDRSLERFKDMFVGTLSGGGTAEGFPALLGFVDLQMNSGGHSTITLTQAGYTFSQLPNPVLDENTESHTATLSSNEANFYLAHVRSVLPQEWELNLRVLGAIAEGKNTPKKVDQVLIGAAPNIRQSELGPTRAGLISRMNELGLVHRKRERVNVFYVMTSQGKSYLETERVAA